MKNWFLQKNEFEQKIIILFAGCILLLLGYAFFYLPIQRQNHQLKIQISDIQTEIETMRQLEQQLFSLGPVHQSQAIVEDSQLIVFIQQIAEQQQLNLADIKSQTNHKILVSLNNVSFNAVIRWLDKLQTQYQVNISQLNVVAEKKSLTNVTVILNNQSNLSI